MAETSREMLPESPRSLTKVVVYKMTMRRIAACDSSSSRQSIRHYVEVFIVSERDC
jgi:hypothetical protein